MYVVFDTSIKTSGECFGVIVRFVIMSVSSNSIGNLAVPALEGNFGGWHRALQRKESCSSWPVVHGDISLTAQASAHWRCQKFR